MRGLARMFGALVGFASAHNLHSESSHGRPLGFIPTSGKTRIRQFKPANPIKGTEADLLGKSFGQGSSKRAKRRKGKS